MTNAGVDPRWLEGIEDGDASQFRDDNTDKPIPVRTSALPGRVVAEPGKLGVQQYRSVFAPSSSSDASSSSGRGPSSRTPPPTLTPEQQQTCREFCDARHKIDPQAWPEGIELRVAPKANRTSNEILLSRYDGPGEDARQLSPSSSHVFLIETHEVLLDRTNKNRKKKAKAKDKDGKRKRGDDDSSDDDYGSDVASGSSASGPSASAVAPPPPPSSIEDRLRRLNEMLATGLISQQAHAEREVQILQEL